MSDGMVETAAPGAPPAGGEASSRWRAWLARLGVAGFMFFLIKGLLWLIIPAVLAMGLFGE